LENTIGTDSVTRVNLDSSHVEKKGDSARLESQSTTPDSSQSHFYKISEPLNHTPNSFAHKEVGIFCFSDDQDLHRLSVMPV